MNAEDNTSSKKKADNASNDNHTAVLDKIDAKRIDKGESESKPRIVLTFRSEKNSTKNSNMKIVSTEEKTEEVPRRSNRTRGKWEWICDSDTSPKKDKSGTQTTSENDESDSSHTNLKRSTRRRSKDCDNVLANAIARKEKSYETQPTPQRLSRRIKPTAKILANEELRIGLESQNIARLGIQTDKSPGEGVRTRRSARPIVVEEKKSPEHHLIEDEVVEIATTDDDSQSQNNVMKLKHLCELGLKAISPEEGDDSGNDNRDEEDEENETEDDDAEEVEAEEIVDEEDDIDDDPNVISKLLETDEEDSDDEFLCTIDVKKKRPRTRRSTRLTSSYDMNDSDEYIPVVEEEHKSPRRSTKRSSRLSYGDESTNFRSKRRRHRSVSNYEGQSDAEIDETSNPAEGEEVAEAVCPVEESTTFATCFCETFSNIYAASEELTEPVFCQAIEMVDGIRVGCSHPARRERTRTGKRTSESLAPMIRAGPRAPYILACSLHAAQFAKHMCCPGCGLFCSQGIFYQCSLGHLFHLDCGLPYNDVKVTQPGCPHCGVYSYTHMGNMQCFKVQIEMKCSNKRIFLPDQREQCTPAYLSFTTQDTKIDQGPIIPKELLPSPPIELKQLGQAPNKSPTQLCDAIMKGETVDQLLPKIVSSSHINKPLASQSGGTCLHAAAKTGHTAALYLLHYAGANLNATDNHTRTPLMLAIITLLEKPENLVKEAAIDKKANDREDMEIVAEKKTAVSVKDDETDTEDIKIKREEDIIETEDCKKEITDDNLERENNKTEIVNDISSKPKEEDLIKVIRYLLAAGCDINFQGPDGMTALHICAQLGGARVASLLLSYSNTLVDVKDQGGWTPLVWAAENDYTDVVKVLLEAGADALTTDSESNGVAHWCALSGAAQSLSLLLHDAPQAADMHNAHADTPLHIAARQGHYACVVILLARGARTDVENAAGELPVEVCTEQCQSAISLNMQMTIAVRDKVSRYKLLSSDISNGREPYPIPCVNEVDDAPLPEDFTYVTRHVTPQPINIDTSIDTMQGCDCKDGDCSSSDCSCCTLGVRCWYTRGRLNASFPYHDPPMLFECNQTCGCNLRRCNNSVVTSSTASSSVCIRTQVFRAGGARGWGLRARQKVLRGEPVALYCGELLRLELADTRAADHYMFALDVKPDLLEQCTDKTQLCVDATQYGSAARFINHSCRPNLAPVRVFTSTRDLRLPAVMLFAIADINPDEELTFDYGDKFWSIKSKWVKCECGAVDCRYPSKSDEIE